MKKNEFIEIEPDINLHIRDWGKGKTIVFIPGWPLSHENPSATPAQAALRMGVRPRSERSRKRNTSGAQIPAESTWGHSVLPQYPAVA